MPRVYHRNTVKKEKRETGDEPNPSILFNKHKKIWLKKRTRFPFFLQIVSEIKLLQYLVPTERDSKDLCCLLKFNLCLTYGRSLTRNYRSSKRGCGWDSIACIWSWRQWIKYFFSGEQTFTVQNNKKGNAQLLPFLVLRFFVLTRLQILTSETVSLQSKRQLSQRLFHILMSPRKVV